MKLKSQHISFLHFVLCTLICVESKGGSGGGGGGGRGGGGGLGRSSSGRGLTRSRAAVLLGSGAAGYAAYRAHKNSKNKDKDDKDQNSPDFDSFEQYFSDPEGKFDYKTQESTSYYASEGIGMSAWGLIALILGIIALCTIGWYCCNVFLPVWQDNRQLQRRSALGGRRKDEVPLQETPSTATPSP